MSRVVPCAVGPDPVPDWFVAGVVDGGGELVPVEEAEALFWYHGSPAPLGELLERGKQLTWVQLPAAGIESYAPFLDDRITWTCAKGVYADPVGEHAVALALAGLRGLVSYARATTWSAPRGRNLYDADVVIIGGGGIAESIVQLLQPYRVTTTVVRRHPDPMPGVHAVVPPEALHEVLPGADVVILAVALTPETSGIIGASELALMADHAWLVNVSRGAHVVTEDLVRALQDGAIGGAALDVTDPEPLDDGHPLWHLDNCIITPHVGNTPDMHRPLLVSFTSDNLRRYAADEPLRGRVDVALGY